MHEVVTGSLWIGNAADADNVKKLLDQQIAAVVDLAYEERPRQLTRDMIYCRFPIVDGANNPPWLLKSAIDNVANLIKLQVPTLVVCGGGMSRSPAIVAAALSHLNGDNPTNRLEKITQNSPHDVSSSLWSDIVAVCESSN